MTKRILLAPIVLLVFAAPPATSQEARRPGESWTETLRAPYETWPELCYASVEEARRWPRRVNLKRAAKARGAVVVSTQGRSIEDRSYGRRNGDTVYAAREVVVVTFVKGDKDLDAQARRALLKDLVTQALPRYEGLLEEWTRFLAPTARARLGGRAVALCAAHLPRWIKLRDEFSNTVRRLAKLKAELVTWHATKSRSLDALEKDLHAELDSARIQSRESNEPRGFMTGAAQLAQIMKSIESNVGLLAASTGGASPSSIATVYRQKQDLDKALEALGKGPARTGSRVVQGLLVQAKSLDSRIRGLLNDKPSRNLEEQVKQAKARLASMKAELARKGRGLSLAQAKRWTQTLYGRGLAARQRHLEELEALEKQEAAARKKELGLVGPQIYLTQVPLHDRRTEAEKERDRRHAEAVRRKTAARRAAEHERRQAEREKKNAAIRAHNKAVEEKFARLRQRLRSAFARGQETLEQQKRTARTDLAMAERAEQLRREIPIMTEELGRLLLKLSKQKSARPTPPKGKPSTSKRKKRILDSVLGD